MIMLDPRRSINTRKIGEEVDLASLPLSLPQQSGLDMTSTLTNDKDQTKVMNVVSLLALASATEVRTKQIGKSDAMSSTNTVVSNPRKKNTLSNTNRLDGSLPHTALVQGDVQVQQLEADQEAWRKQSPAELRHTVEAKGVKAPPMASSDLLETLLALKGGYGPVGKRVGVQKIREWVNNADYVLREVGLLSENGTSLMDLLNARIESAKLVGMKRPRSTTPRNSITNNNNVQTQSIPQRARTPINSNDNAAAVATVTAIDSTTTVAAATVKALCGLSHKQLIESPTSVQQQQCRGNIIETINSTLPLTAMQPVTKKRAFLVKDPDLKLDSTAKDGARVTENCAKLFL